MPDMDGFETAAMIRSRRQTAHTPIIFVTAFSDEMHTAQGYSLGAVDYILSPVVPEILRTKVGVFVDLYKKTLQVRRQAEERVALARAQAAQGRRRGGEPPARRSSPRPAPCWDSRSTSRPSRKGWCDRPSRSWATSACCASRTIRAMETLSPSLRGSSHREPRRVRSRSTPAKRLSHFPQSSAASFETGKPETCPQIAEISDLTTATPISNALGRARFLRGASRFRFRFVDRPLARSPSPGASLRRPSRPTRFHCSKTLLAAAVAVENARLYRHVQENNRRKNEFLAMLAHELRNPLAPIRSAVELLQMLELDDENLNWASEVIARQVDHMVRLVDDLLDISRITGGKIQLRVETIDSRSVVDRAVETSRPLLDERKHTLKLSVPNQPLPIKADPVRLAQVLANLLNNAAKYTEPGGKIDLELIRSGSEAVFSVRDNGLGISAEKLSAVFELFTQVDHSLDRARRPRHRADTGAQTSRASRRYRAS